MVLGLGAVDVQHQDKVSLPLVQYSKNQRSNIQLNLVKYFHTGDGMLCYLFVGSKQRC